MPLPDPHLTMNDALTQFQRQKGMPAQPVPATPPPATLDAGGHRYRRLRRLGSGATGIVDEVVDENGRRFALKELRPGPDGVCPGEDVHRFRTTAKSLVGLQHPHILPVYDVGESNGRPFLVMELAEGGTLARLIKPSGGRTTAATVATGAPPVPQPEPLTDQDGARLLMHLARALHHAHENGIIHRDLKPANVLLVRKTSQAPTTPAGPLREYDAKLSDFGLAKLSGNARGPGLVSTLTGTVMGTVDYMPPEQASVRRGKVGPASDVYGLGAILYECLAGRPPFRGRNDLETVQLVLNTGAAAPPLHLQRPDVSPDLEAICLKCLEKDPKNRYATAAELADELQRFVEGQPIRTRRVGPVVRWYRDHRPLARGLIALAVLLTSLLGAAVFAAGYYLHLSGKLQEEVDAKKANLYANNLARAEVELTDDRDVAYAEQLLDNCPEELRGWEYHHLKRRLDDPKTAVVTLGSAKDKELDLTRGNWQATFSHEGGLLAVATITEGVLLYRAEDPGKVRRVVGPSLLGVRLPVYGVAFSPDDRLLVVATQVLKEGSFSAYEHVIQVYEVASFDKPNAPLDKPKWTLRGHTNIVRGLSINPQGTRLASGGYDSQVRLWDLTTGESAGVLGQHDGWVNAVAFTPDGKQVASAAADGTVVLWDVGQKKRLRGWKAHNSPVQAVAFHPGGRQFVTVGMDGLVRLWDDAAANYLLSLSGHLGPALGVAFSPDGSRVASCGADRTIKVWDVAAGRLVLTLRGHTDMIWSVEFSRDGKNSLLSAGFDATPRLWRAGPYKPAKPGPARKPSAAPDARPDQNDLPNDVTFRPDGLEYAVSGWEGRVVVYDGQTRAVKRELKRGGRSAHEGPVWRLAYSADGRRLASASWDGTVRVWDGNNGGLLRELAVGVGGHGVAFSPDGRRLVVGTIDGKVTVWDLEAEGGAKPLPPELKQDFPYLIYAVAWSADGRWIVSGGYTSGVYVWDAETGERVAKLGAGSFIARQAQPLAHQSSVYQLAFSPDGKRLASVSWDRKVLLWKVPAQNQRRWETTPVAVQAGQGRGHSDYINTVAFSPDGRRVATGGFDKRVQLWDVATGKADGEPYSLRGQVWGLAWHPSPEQNTLLVANWYRPAGVQMIVPPPKAAPE